MSYININEVDNTIQDLAPVQSDNIVYVPLNSSDGPSGVYNVIQDYGDFVSLYGENPDPNSTVMTSWEFAANLLLRKMPVMVRRITNKIDENGNDTTELLEGASRAKGLLKVTDVIGASMKTSEPVSKEISFGDGFILKDNNTIVSSDTTWNKAAGEFNKIEVYSSATVATPSASSGSSARGNGLAIKLNDVSYEADMPDEEAAYSQGGGVSIYNSGISPAYISKFEVAGLKYSSSKNKPLTYAEKATPNHTIIDLSGVLTCEVQQLDLETTKYRWLETTLAAVINNARIFVINSKGESVPLSSITVRNGAGTLTDSEEQCVPVIELPAGYTLKYSLDYGDTYLGVTTYNVANDDGTVNDLALELNTFVSSKGKNSVYVCATSLMTAQEPETESIKQIVVDTSALVTYATVASPDGPESVDTASEYDKDGNINLLKMYYRHVGSTGSRFSAAIRVLQGDGIYLRVYSGSQRVENIQLVNFRYRTATGRYAYYDIYADREIIWKLFLENFGIKYPVEVGTTSKTLSTRYLDIVLNESLDYSFVSYLDSIYMCKGDTTWPLEGGSCPSESCVEPEVHKTYSPLKDKYLYDIKFVSNGGFVDREIEPASVVLLPQLDENTRFVEDAQIALAEARGDCLAFVDTPLDMVKEDAPEYFSHISTSYAASYAPWVKLNLLTRTTKWCPASFAALWTIAKSVNDGNKVYAPPAGVNRAHITECEDLMYVVPSEYIDSWQDNHTQFINPIVYINGYGVNIFGQRTLYNKIDAEGRETSALQYLNVRLVANEIKKKIFKSCIELTFEYNNLHTWLAFKSKMSELLDTLLYNHAITWYNVVMDESTMTSADIQSNHIVGIVSVAVSSTAEKFDITFELMPNQVNFVNIDYSTNSSDDAYGKQG